jgi:ubiquinone biosynthesis protein
MLVSELGLELDRIDRRRDGAITFEQLGATVGRLLAVLQRGGFRMPKELVLFFKNLLYLSGFAASVAPEADLFAVIDGTIEKLVPAG